MNTVPPNDQPNGPRSRVGEMFSLEGKVAVVIGGAGVLGGRMAAVLAAAGARVVIADRDPEKGSQAAEELRTEGGHIDSEPCDATDRQQLRGLVSRVVDVQGRIDVLINGAGVNSDTPFVDISDEELDRLVSVNQLATVRSCQEFGRYFTARAAETGEGASIINVGSSSGVTPLSKVFTYSMTKAAVHNLTKNLAREWGPLGIRCNVLVPGFFPAEQNRQLLTPERVDAIFGHTPLGRFGEANELGGAILLLASDAGRFITGSELVVDGGFNAMTI